MTPSEPASDSTPGIWQWFARRPNCSLALLVLVCLGPFVTKPFHVDDPLFVRVAQFISHEPANPYGFKYNWYGAPVPMWEITKNPPLTCYYLALAGTIFGWSEIALHSAMLLPAIAAILGVYRLARHFCRRPGLAAVLTLFTPVFLISSSTLTCDTMMLAFWVWAIALWLEGLELESRHRLATAGVLMALAALTKYFGACLVPLLFVYTVVRQRKLGAWTLWLLVPLATLAAYQWATYGLYGKGLFSDAGGYAQVTRGLFGISMVSNCIITVVFTGACMAMSTFLVPTLWPRRTLLFLGLAVALTFLAAFFSKTLSWYKMYENFSLPVVSAQMAFWLVGGGSILGLALADFRRERNAASALLGLWLLGTLMFTALCNWIVNGRSLLPLAPVAALLFVRRWDLFPPRKFMASLGIVLGLTLSLGTVWSDYCMAAAVRKNVDQIVARFGQKKSRLWFDGHWGFQYYMEVLGMKALDWNNPQAQRSDFLAIPFNNDNYHKMDTGLVRFVAGITNQGPGWLTTLNTASGAGFYASLKGPLPFAFGRVPPEAALVFILEPSQEKAAP